MTFWLQCYRHEAYVEEAVRSVLAQTYRPLEILISDDASPDRTFQLASALARAYNGPHRVALYRSEQNRDIFPHWNEVAPHVRGAFILWMSGDDVAEPGLAEAFVKAWRLGDAASVWCSHSIIDANGKSLGLSTPSTLTLDLNDFAEGRFLDFSYGSTQGFERAVIDRFGPLPVHVARRGLEHQIGFRSALLGRRRYVAEPLVRKRRHLGRASVGMNARDQHVDSLSVHEGRIHVRLQILCSLHGYLVGADGEVLDHVHDGLAAALLRQIDIETERQLELRAFQERRSRSGDPGGPEFQHAGLQYAPNGLTFVRELPGGFNLLAAECQYHAVPQRRGAIEPCGLRNRRYPGVVSGWTEADVVAALTDGNGWRG